MEATKIHEYARQLKQDHGEKALAEAAQKRAEFEKEGDAVQADTWRKIESALKEMQGPHSS
jgi:hypothetical protein